MGRRKALLIGINYFGQEHELEGCEQDVQNVCSFLISRGYSTDPRDMVVMTESRGRGPYYPDSHNILAAMNWLVSEPGCCLFLHYSGHGGQVEDPTGARQSGYDSTIVPVDYQTRGQINSTILHRSLVSALPPNSTMFVILDCCHSGSTLELPWVYKADEYGNVNLMDNMEAGMALLGEAQGLIQGGFHFENSGGAQHLLAGATDFFRSLQHESSGEGGSGLAAEDDFGEDWSREQRSVFMFSGCKDDQTSADAFIAGKHVGKYSSTSRSLF